jgi:23S rRNA pseudouridine1911/1915/1917 synthase
MTRIEVGADVAGRTLAALVREDNEGMPWSKARKVVAAGKVKVDGQVRRDPAERAVLGTVVEIDLAAPSRPEPQADVPILHLDPSVVVVDKPAGLLTVPWEDETDTLLHRAHAAVKRRTREPRLPPLRVVQRLDKETSGVLVFARTKQAERSLGDQLRRHSVDRRYLALVIGAPVRATIDTFLLADRGDGRRGSAKVRPSAQADARGRSPAPAGAKRSITHVEPLERFEVPGGIVSLVACRLSTGRQHQIRIHLAEAGHPLVGERVYGARDLARPLDAARPMLHAERLGFLHPADDRPVLFQADPPADFAELLARLRGRRGA